MSALPLRKVREGHTFPQVEVCNETQAQWIIKVDKTHR